MRSLSEGIRKFSVIVRSRVNRGDKTRQASGAKEFGGISLAPGLSLGLSLGLICLLFIGIRGGTISGAAVISKQAQRVSTESFHAVSAHTVSAHAITFNETWSQTLPDTGNPIALSSPNVATLDSSGPSVVVGDRAGNVYAFHLSNGSSVAGWPRNLGAPVDSSPSVSPGAGPNDIYIGAGNPSDPTGGGYFGLQPNGSVLWDVTAQNPSTDPTPTNGVQASLAVGGLQSATAAVAGSLGQVAYAINTTNGVPLGGWNPWFQGDSSFSTPAIADLYRNGQNEVIAGGDSTTGVAYGTQYTQGGHLRVISANGNLGQPEPNDGLDCSLNTDEAMHSSPAVGEFLGGTAVGIVSGTSDYFAGASYANSLVATNANCGVVWKDTLDGDTTSSPALADALGNGQLQVIEGTNVGSYSSGTVYVLNGANGNAIWSVNTPAIVGSIVTADLSGSGYQDLLVPTLSGVLVLDGQNGTNLGVLGQFQGFQNSPLVTNDPNGTIGITIAGYNSNNQGVVEHYEVANSAGHASVYEAGAWPQFHHDPQLTGDAGTSVQIQVPCNAPTSPNGYYEVASDGGIFNYGNLAFCGSTGAITLNQPIVGMASTPDAGGYWLVAKDGGIFAFGDAQTHFYGSLPGLGISVNDIVGIAVTPNGQGYYEVASDGGIFAFGATPQSAPFYGSMGGKPLNQPIVAIAGF